MQPQPFTFRGGVGRWLKTSVERFGLLGAAGHTFTALFELLCDLTPARRRLRYGDLEFDWEHRVDTTWSNITLGTRLREMVAEGKYQPTDPALFAEIMSGLDINTREFTFIDFGSGKGRVLLLASEYGFHRIIGVELLPELHAIAEANVRKYKDGVEAKRIELWCGDAREFSLPEEPAVLYLNNPFPEHILQEVMTNLGRSLREHPRKVVLVYANPLLEQVVENAGFLRKTNGTNQYSTFRNF